jgi:hypothetical protein
MTSESTETLPEALRSVGVRPLFVLRETVPPLSVVGDTPSGFRRIGLVTGGWFEGERLRGAVASGEDWQVLRRDNCLKLDARVLLKTDDGALITMIYQGLRAAAPDVLAKLDRGEPVDPADYYFRFSGVFEAADPRYDWLNRIIAVGTGERRADGPLYSVFELL